MSSEELINVYDFDHTIYGGDASLDFIIYCTLRNPRTWRHIPRQIFAIINFALGRLDRKQIKQAAFLFLGDTKDLNTQLEKFWDSHERKIKKWYLDQKQPSDIIISASPEFLLQPIIRRLAVQPVIATIMDVRTGVITGENNRAVEKVTRLQAHNSTLRINHFYSDSMSDAPLFKLAKEAYLVKRRRVIAIPRSRLM